MRIPSQLHRKLGRYLNECGIDWEPEVPRGPYQIDCYSERLNLGFEADGPWHGLRREKDERRDRYLWEVYGIKVLRLNATHLHNPTVAKVEIISFVSNCRIQSRTASSGGSV